MNRHLMGADFYNMHMRNNMLSMLIHMRTVHEDVPGEKWQHLFYKLWPFYRRWYLREGFGARPGFLTCYEKLETHMPELLPVYHQLCQLTGNGDLEARYLSMWNPPAFMSGCSQMTYSSGGSTALLRNYDYSPALFDGIFIKTNWLQPVMGMMDSSWGLLDGINASGLAVSLTFGGRNIMGNGFGIPLVLRYVLETCHNTYDAIQVLCRMPVHMAYNVTVADKSGFTNTVYLSPDRSPLVTDDAFCTNHQITVEWEDYARISGTQERMQYLRKLWNNKLLSINDMASKFLNAPLYNTQYEKSFGTLYSAVYLPGTGEVNLLWPNRAVTLSFQHFPEELHIINVSKQINSLLVS
jgi:predicted choloylglycine hydrolase